MNGTNSGGAKAEDLKLIYDQYIAAVRKKNIIEAGKLLTEKFKAELYPPDISAEDMAGFMDMAVAMQPVSYTIDYLDAGGAKVSLYITATLNNPQLKGATSRLEMMIGFAMEGGVWKMAAVNYQMDPDKIKRSPDQDFEPKDNYNLDKNTSMGGRIVFVKFEKDFTLVGIRMLDEENLAFLPDKASLEKSGLKTELLVPWKILKVDGYPHKTNPMKIWGEKAEIVEADAF